jgi:amino acid transporter
VVLIGLLNACYGFSGYEAGGHMAEETVNSSKSAPKGIIYACIATALTGFLYLLGLLYSC